MTQKTESCDNRVMQEVESNEEPPPSKQAKMATAVGKDGEEGEKINGVIEEKQEETA